LEVEVFSEMLVPSYKSTLCHTL